MHVEGFTVWRANERKRSPCFLTIFLSTCPLLHPPLRYGSCAGSDRGEMTTQNSILMRGWPTSHLLLKALRWLPMLLCPTSDRHLQLSPAIVISHFFQVWLNLSNKFLNCSKEEEDVLASAAQICEPFLFKETSLKKIVCTKGGGFDAHHSHCH